MAADEVGEPALARIRCTGDPDVAALAWLLVPIVLAASAEAGRVEKTPRSCGEVAALHGALAATACAPGEELPWVGDWRRRGVVSILVAGGVCARCGGGDGEPLCRDCEGMELCGKVPRPLPYLDGRAVVNAAGAMALPGLGDTFRDAPLVAPETPEEPIAA